MELNSASQRIIADLLYSRTGQTLTHDRSWRLPGALANVFRANGVSNVDQLVCLLAQPGSDALATATVEALLNNETYFCRDRTMLDAIQSHVLPSLRDERRHERRLRIWCAGCSTGQEPLTIAMMFADHPELWDGWTISIHATDVSRSAIATARSATYTQFEIQRGLSVLQMLTYFDETSNGWRPKTALSDRITYSVDNLLNPTLSAERFDLILCRNVLLYFDRESRARALGRISSSIRPDGWLMLGAGETVIGDEKHWQPAGLNSGLYRPANISLPKMGEARSNRIA